MNQNRLQGDSAMETSVNFPDASARGGLLSVPYCSPLPHCKVYPPHAGLAVATGQGDAGLARTIIRFAVPLAQNGQSVALRSAIAVG